MSVFDGAPRDEAAVPLNECCWNCTHMVSHGPEECMVEHGFVMRIIGVCRKHDDERYTREVACRHVCPDFEFREGPVEEYRLQVVAVVRHEPHYVKKEQNKETPNREEGTCSEEGGRKPR